VLLFLVFSALFLTGGFFKMRVAQLLDSILKKNLLQGLIPAEGYTKPIKKPSPAHCCAFIILIGT